MSAEACYERVYDGAHLSRNSAQQTTSIRASLAKPRSDGAILRIEVARRGQRESRFSALGDCSGHPNSNVLGSGEGLVIPTMKRRDAITCIMTTANLDEEGGTAGYELLDGGRGLRIHIQDSMVMQQTGAIRARNVPIAFGPADRVFDLRRVDAVRCDALAKAHPGF